MTPEAWAAVASAVLALAASVVSLLAETRSLRLPRRVATIEQARRDEELDRHRAADVTARFGYEQEPVSGKPVDYMC